MKKPRLVVLTGPTAVGKTGISVQLARYLDTEIISADSRQFYREMKIGTAAPTGEEMQDVPHHFIGHLTVTENYNVSDYEQDVLRLLDQLFLKYPVVIMTGGSGLYINAVCFGIDDMPDADDSIRAELRQLLAAKGREELALMLKSLDPVYYLEADLNNPNRLLRALEVCLQSGMPYSSLRKNTRKNRDFEIVRIGLYRDRPELNQRIGKRVDQMVTDGLEEEVSRLLPFRHLNALNTVGYKEIFRFFDGEISREQAITDIKTHSRRYAKRQMTWFRKEEDMIWCDAGSQNLLKEITDTFQ